jgi:hypothetical protein
VQISPTQTPNVKSGDAIVAWIYQQPNAVVILQR